MQRQLAFLALTALLMIWSCSPPLDQASTRAELMEADRAFAVETAERGIDGWVETFAEDGAMFPAGGPVVRGRAAIRKLMSPAFEDEAFSLVWEPTEADVSGELGYTIGRSERTATGPDGTLTTSIGKYITIWKKQPDGTWKVVADIGTPNDAP